MFQIGLNPYGIAYSIGLFGDERPNPHPLGLSGFLDLADSIGARGVELPIALLKGVPESETESITQRLHTNGRYAILMHGISWGELDAPFEHARRFDIKTIRMHLTSVLCGARGAMGARKWQSLYNESRAQFKTFCARAAAEGLAVTLEDHQDLTSAELLELCNECGDHVGICLDTGNPYAVGEDPVEFAEAVCDRVRHVHLKDYKIFSTKTGYRLARCAIGEGVIPFQTIAQILNGQGPLPASIEPGALESRHVELLNQNWWQGYAPRPANALALVLLSARSAAQPEDADWRTPWEKGAAPEAVAAYELDELHRSVDKLKHMGLLQ